MSKRQYRQICSSPQDQDRECEFRENDGCTLRGECTWLRVRPIINQEKRSPESKEVGVFGGRVEDIKDEKLRNILLGPHASQKNGDKRRDE